MPVSGRRKAAMGFMARLWSGVGLGGAYFSPGARVAPQHPVLSAADETGLRANQGELCSCELCADVIHYTSSACSAPAYRQFYFFVGDWDTYDVQAPDKLVARNTVKAILNGCVVHEDYRQHDGLHGESYSLYDAARNVWHQSWVTNRGDLLLLDGGMQGDRMVFKGVERKVGKPDALVRAVWYRQGDGVREAAERSLDGGKTWKTEFDILFKPHE